MLPGPSDHSHFFPITHNSFSKDGRNISVGDCALFKPPKDLPPFVGIIRSLIISKEGSFSLCVSWLYRPADVKPLKGLVLEAPPNELFYSFHEDETPAASLLHPCKVAFLRKGVQLPSGISSFVCRRVYDTEEKCLWWLTDKNYLEERQKEVDQLIDKTRVEMFGAAELGCRSPKTLDASQLKPGADSVQNSSSSFHSQAKGNKRELFVQGSGPFKRERTCKEDQAEFDQLATDQMLKHEIAKITDRGGLTDFEGVDKLVQLMQPDDCSLKKLDIAGRVMLVNVIAVTDRFDCLTRFVKLRGLPVLDDWLRQVHKGKLEDNSSPKEGEKSADEFLLSLLRALDKLPVNLHALQTCNIGKSVNHLRSHRNSEIQKKARILVDTWKKRVKDEMSMIDTKTGSGRGGSWPTKSLNSEASNVIVHQNKELTEPAVINSNAQCGVSKIPSAKPGSSDKFSVGSSGTAKQSPSVTASDVASTKDLCSIALNLSSVALVGTGSSDAPLTTIRVDKCNRSSQSQNYCQSCSSDSGKKVSCREEARSLTAGSMNVIETSNGVKRKRKLNNGHQGTQTEITLEKLSYAHGSLSCEKLSPTRLTSERTPDAPHVDNGNKKRFNVRLPNAASSPACSASGGSGEDVSATSSKSSVGQDGKVKFGVETIHTNCTVNVKVDTYQGKVGLLISEDANASSGGVHCAERIRGGEYPGKLEETSEAACSPSRITARYGKSYQALFSSMNALVDRCVKISEANVNAPLEDPSGMNLLASVAAGEIPSKHGSPSVSFDKKSSIPEDSCSANDIRFRQTDEDRNQSEDQHKEVSSGVDLIGHGSSNAKFTDVDMAKKLSMDGKVALLGCEEKTVDCGAVLDTCNGPISISPDKPPEPIQGESAPVSCEKVGEKVDAGGDKVDQFQELRKLTHTWATDDSASNPKLEGRCDNSHKTLEVNGVPVFPEDAATGANLEAEADEELQSSSDRCNEGNKIFKKESSGMHKEADDAELPCLPSTGARTDHEAATDDEVKLLHANQREDKRLGLDSLTVNYSSENSHRNPEKKYESNIHYGGSPGITVPESKQPTNSSGFKSDVAEEYACISYRSSVPAAVSDLTVKLDFDLNEGLPIDDGSSGEFVKLPAPENMSIFPLPFPLPVSISSMAEGPPPIVTFASAAKGPYAPPQNSSRIAGELGWRGSAATSAFRPAEPRKILDTPTCTVSVPSVDNFASIQGRPLLDFDLNVPDEGTVEEGAPQKYIATCLETRHLELNGGGLHLDLNRSDDSPEIGHFSVSNCRMELSKRPVGSSLSGAESKTSRDFDLNNGPGSDEVVSEAGPYGKNIIPFSSSIPAVRMNNMELRNFSWFSPGDSCSGLVMPPTLPAGKGDQNYPILPSASSKRIMLPPGNTSFSPDLYRGPFLSSSPAVGYTPNIQFQYPTFPFETSYSLSSNFYSGVSTPYVDSSSGGSHCISSVPSQLIGPTGMVPMVYSRPFVMSLSGSTSDVAESKKWGGQGLDLNAGPGLDQREEKLPSAPRQLPLTASQALPDEQLKMYQQMARGLVGRKEPDEGWEGDRISYKHPPWQ